MAHARKPKADAAAPYPPGWEPFLAAINANIDDDTPRLVFADWLQENGDEARAEFIRIQCELWRKHPGYGSVSTPLGSGEWTDADRETRKREFQLERENLARWIASLPEWARDRAQFRRGFVFYGGATARQWLKEGAKLRAQTPIENVGLTRPEGLEEKLFRSPSLVGLNRLFLPDVTLEASRVLADSPVLDSLHGLALGEPARRGTEVDPALFASARLGNLRRLWLRALSGGNAILAAVAASLSLRGLEEFEVLGILIDPGAFRALLASPNASDIRTLNFQACHMGNAAAEALANSTLTALEELNLRYNGLTAAAARALAAWPGLRSVRTLSLRGNEFGPEGVRELLASPHLTSIQTLELPGLGVHKRDRERIEAMPEYQRIARVSYG